MRRTLATTAAALVIGAAAAGPAVAAPAYPPNPTGEVVPSVAPSATRPAVLTQNAPADSLAFTGTDVAVVGGAAAALVAGGVVLVRVSRRRGEHAL